MPPVPPPQRLGGVGLSRPCHADQASSSPRRASSLTPVHPRGFLLPLGDFLAWTVSSPLTTCLVQFCSEVSGTRFEQAHCGSRHCSQLLLQNELPRTLGSNTMSGYYLAVSMGQECGCGVAGSPARGLTWLQSRCWPALGSDLRQGFSSKVTLVLGGIHGLAASEAVAALLLQGRQDGPLLRSPGAECCHRADCPSLFPDSVT